MAFFSEIAQSIDSVSSGLNSLFSGANNPVTNNKKYSNALYQQLLKYDVGRSSYFEVQIFAQNKSISTPGPKPSAESLTYLCHSAELPGEATATVTQKHYSITEKYSVITGYNDVALSFYTRGSDTEISRLFFQAWISYITGRGETVKGSGKQTTYNVKYKSDYAATIKITHYSITGQPLVEVTLLEAFPISINQIPLSWSAQNQAQSLNVVFAYTEYEYNFLHVQANSPYSRGPLGELLGTAIQTASTVNTIQNAFKSGNPFLATSALPNLGMSNFTLSSGLNKIGIK